MKPTIRLKASQQTPSMPVTILNLWKSDTLQEENAQLNDRLSLMEKIIHSLEKGKEDIQNLY
jgi:hypothetical protein